MCLRCPYSDKSDTVGHEKQNKHTFCSHKSNHHYEFVTIHIQVYLYWDFDKAILFRNLLLQVHSVYVQCGTDDSDIIFVSQCHVIDWIKKTSWTMNTSNTQSRRDKHTCHGSKHTQNLGHYHHQHKPVVIHNLTVSHAYSSNIINVLMLLQARHAWPVMSDDLPYFKREISCLI